MKKIKTLLTKSIISKLKCGEEVLLSGTIYTARDQAHKKMAELISRKKRLPFNAKNATIYYAGPTPEREDASFGSCGPTTSSRMDFFTPFLLGAGVFSMIGKGNRSEKIRNLIKKHKAVYFVTIGGTGAYLAKRIKKSKTVAFRELGPEAIYELEVENFPLIVAIDSKGNDIYGSKKRGINK